MVPRILFSPDWDRRHKFIVNVDYHYGSEQGPKIGNFFILENFNWNILWQASSGLPYTPQSLTGQDLVELTNTRRIGWNSNLDMRLRRFFDVSSTRLGLIFEVRNLLNNRNEIGIDDSGIVDRYRDLVGFTNDGTSRSRNYGGYANAAPNPNAWQSGREILVGAQFEF